MGKGSLKSKQDRRDRLLGLLRSEDYWTTLSLAQELSVSPRTLMRDLLELKEAGYPIETDRGRGGGVSLTGRWGIDRLSLSNQEAITLVLSLAVIESLSPSSNGLGAKSLRQKISSSFGIEQRKVISKLRNRILIGDPASKDVLSSYKGLSDTILGKVKLGFFNSKRIRFTYHDERKRQTTREVDANFLMLSWPVWYLLGWDYLREDVRVFRIDRMTNIEVLNLPAANKPKQLFLEAFEPYFSAI
ncbi:MAG: WYL domain-containing protein [Bdellovibrionales bacterium]|nr:WYL domain-containing protein [Bdellovibrionales bacterium]